MHRRASLSAITLAIAALASTRCGTSPAAGGHDDAGSAENKLDSGSTTDTADAGAQPPDAAVDTDSGTVDAGVGDAGDTLDAGTPDASTADAGALRNPDRCAAFAAGEISDPSARRPASDRREDDRFRRRVARESADPHGDLVPGDRGDARAARRSVQGEAQRHPRGERRADEHRRRVADHAREAVGGARRAATARRQQRPHRFQPWLQGNPLSVRVPHELPREPRLHRRRARSRRQHAVRPASTLLDRGVRRRAPRGPPRRPHVRHAGDAQAQRRHDGLPLRLIRAGARRVDRPLVRRVDGAAQGRDRRHRDCNHPLAPRIDPRMHAIADSGSIHAEFGAPRRRRQRRSHVRFPEPAGGVRQDRRAAGPVR